MPPFLDREGICDGEVEMRAPQGSASSASRLWRARLLACGLRGLHVIQNLLRIPLRRPDFPQEVRGMDVVFAEEGAIAAAAEHDVRVHLATKLGLGFRDDARQPDDAFERI